MNRAALRELAQALPAGAALPVPREWLLELLGPAEASSAASAVPPADLTVTEVAARFTRKPATVREWAEDGRLPGAYKMRGREWRIPLAGVLAFEAGERAAGSPPERGTRRAGPRVTPLTRLLKRQA